jgi:hypothetical protein
MSKEDYERLGQELKKTRHKDHPGEYDTLSPEAKEALQYWIEHAIKPAKKADDRHSSYGLQHDYQHETTLYISNAQFKGAMLMAGYLPTDKNEQHWHFKIGPTYDEKSFSQEATRQNAKARLPIYRTTPQGEQDPQLHALVQKVRDLPRGDDSYSVMI